MAIYVSDLRRELKHTEKKRLTTCDKSAGEKETWQEENGNKKKSAVSHAGAALSSGSRAVAAVLQREGVKWCLDGSRGKGSGDWRQKVVISIRRARMARLDCS